MTSSGRDSNPRPSGPKPDALARLRYRSIFGIFQPIGRGLSITHLEAWRGGEYFSFACAAPARHSELMPVLRIFRRCFVGGMKNGRGTGGCIANHGLDIGYLPFAPLSLISCTTSRPGLMNRKRKTHVRVRLNNNRFYSCASSNPKLSRLGIFRAPARAPKRTGLLNACPQDLLLWRPSAFFWLSGERAGGFFADGMEWDFRGFRPKCRKFRAQKNRAVQARVFRELSARYFAAGAAGAGVGAEPAGSTSTISTSNMSVEFGGMPGSAWLP